MGKCTVVCVIKAITVYLGAHVEWQWMDVKHCVTCIYRLACLLNASPINETALTQSVTCIIHVTGVVMVDRPKTYRGSSHAHAGVLSAAPLTSSLKDARVTEVTLSHDPSGTVAVALLVLIVLVFV